MAEHAELIAELRARIAELQNTNKTLETAQKELSNGLAEAQREKAKIAKSLEAAEVLAAKVPELEKSSAETAKLIKAREAEHAQAIAAKDADFGRTIAFTRAGVSDPGWQDVFLKRYEAQREKGEADLSKWLEAQRAADPASITDGVLAAAIKAHPPAGKAEQAEAKTEQAGGANPWAGRGGTGFARQNDGQGPSAKPNVLTEEQIMKMTPAELQANHAALVATHPSLAYLAQEGVVLS